jgi:hypothetical protein
MAEISCTIALNEQQFELVWKGHKSYHKSVKYANIRYGDTIKFVETTPPTMPIGEFELTGKKIYAVVTRLYDDFDNNTGCVTVQFRVTRKIRTRIAEINYLKMYDTSKRTLQGM